MLAPQISRVRVANATATPALPQALSRPQVFELHTGPLQVQENAAALQRPLNGLHQGPLVGRVGPQAIHRGAELFLRVLLLAGLVQVGVQAEEELGVASFLDQAGFELFPRPFSRITSSMTRMLTLCSRNKRRLLA